MFAIRKARRDGPPTCAGSHLDTQPTGGRYDGILGVCAGIELLRVLHENNVETEYPVGVVNWTNEEGARFPISMVSSGVWAGEIALAKAHALRESGEGKRTMKQELRRIGYLGVCMLCAQLEQHNVLCREYDCIEHTKGIAHDTRAKRKLQRHLSADTSIDLEHRLQSRNNAHR